MATLYMMVGVSGSGKSTYAKSLGCQIFSSDMIRKELYGDEAIQKDPNKVFRILHGRVVECLRAGNSCVFDATNLNRKKRAAFLKQIENIKDVRKVCIVIATPHWVCGERDEERARTVGAEVICRQISQFQIPTKEEGWDNIYFYREETYPINLLIPKKEIPHDCAPHHLESIQEHSKMVYQALLDGFPGSLNKNLMVAAKYHDIGKFYTKEPHKKYPERSTYYSHENWSTYLFICSDEFTYEAAMLIAFHMEPFKQDGGQLKFLPEELKGDLNILNFCDNFGRIKG